VTVLPMAAKLQSFNFSFEPNGGIENTDQRAGWCKLVGTVKGTKLWRVTVSHLSQRAEPP
jgi:hypothetical protein